MNDDGGWMPDSGVPPGASVPAPCESCRAAVLAPFGPAALLPGRRLFLVAGDGGLETLLAIAREPDLGTRFPVVALAHERGECALRRRGVPGPCPVDACRGAGNTAGLRCLAVDRCRGRTSHGPLAEALTSGRLAGALGGRALDARYDRLLVAGSAVLLHDVRQILSQWGFEESVSGRPAHYAVALAPDVESA